MNAVLIVLFTGPALFAQTSPQGLQALLKTHRAWAASPASIEIAGTSTRGKVTGPIKITATRLEEAVTEYGQDRLVATQSSFFKEIGSKLSRQPTESGFTQLDVTSVFLVSLLADRPTTVSAPQPAIGPAGPATRLRVSSRRSQIHYAKLTVPDELDLYVASSGLLTGLSRSFYPTSKRFAFTLAYAFSDYRDTGGVLLPYRIDKYLKGVNIETIQVTSYRIDVPTTATMFQPRRTR
jgi:hypothetical protein